MVGKLANHLVLLTKFYLDYLTKKTIKGREIVKFLALNPVSDEEEIELQFSYDLTSAIEVHGWKMYFDGVVNQFRVGIEVILVTPKNKVVPISKNLALKVINK